jgi:hypothetical protein
MHELKLMVSKAVGLMSLRLTGLVASFVIGLLIIRTMIWDSYHQLIMNDGDSILFFSYVQNIVNCPFEVSKLLMVDALSKNCLNIVDSQGYTYYSDHPSGFLILLSFFYRAGFESLSSMRWISVAVTFFIALIIYSYSLKNKNARFGAFVFLGFLLTPLFLFHAFIIHIFTWAQLFSLLIGITFVEEVLRPQRYKRILLFIFLLIGFTIDWPVFVLAGVVFVFSIWFKRVKLAILVLSFSIISYTLVRLWIYSSNSVTQQSIISELLESLGRGESLQSLLLVPIYFLKAHFLGALGILVLPFFAYKFRKTLRENPVLLLGLILLTQGVLNILLFLPWAASHIYWTYFLIPPSVIGFGFLLEEISKKRLYFKTLVILMTVSSAIYSYAWWVRDYQSQPISLISYFQVNGLPKDWLTSDSKIYTFDKSIHIGQSAKVRLLLDQQFEFLTHAEIPLSGYLVAKLGEEIPLDIGKPVQLSWLEWDVYSLNRMQN